MHSNRFYSVDCLHPTHTQYFLLWVLAHVYVNWRLCCVRDWVSLNTHVQRILKARSTQQCTNLHLAHFGIISETCPVTVHSLALFLSPHLLKMQYNIIYGPSTIYNTYYKIFVIFYGWCTAAAAAMCATMHNHRYMPVRHIPPLRTCVSMCRTYSVLAMCLQAVFWKY